VIDRAPAVIVFCREPIPHESKTRLIGRLSAAAAAALADAFIRDALAKAVRARPSRIVIAASAPNGAGRSPYFRRLARQFGADLFDQGTGSLGRRMERALAPFASDSALLIGTDTPSLPAELLARSLAALRGAKVVVAPSLDGGYYAVGVRGAMPLIFAGIRWGRADVLRITLHRLTRAHIRFALGPAWYDVDRWSDVMLLAAHLRLLARVQGARNSPCPATTAVLRQLGVLRSAR
jgi:rSAM/selenodomain-associated transferase 1